MHVNSTYKNGILKDFNAKFIVLPYKVRSNYHNIEVICKIAF